MVEPVETSPGRRGHRAVEPVETPRRDVRRQQLGRHRRRRRRAHLPEDQADRHHPRQGRADGRDPVRPGPARLLPRDPAGHRRGARPVRRRHVLHPRRQAARRVASELRRRGLDRPGERQDRQAPADGRLPRRPHGGQPGPQAAPGVGLDVGHRPRVRPRRGRQPPHRQAAAHVRVRRDAAREQLLRRRQPDLPRQHRQGLHARATPPSSTR